MIGVTLRLEGRTVLGIAEPWSGFRSRTICFGLS